MNKGGNHSVGPAPLLRAVLGLARFGAREPLFKGRRNQTAGFTIVETLIVLAVTGTLFASAVLLINGRQARTEFQTGINDTQQRIQQLINETASGYFPDSGNFKCSGSTGGAPTFGSTATAQGTNDGCVFMGKIVQFSPTSMSDPAGYLVYPLAGNRRASSAANAQEVSKLYGASGAYPQAITSLATTARLSNGFRLVKSSSTAPAHLNFSAVGFLQSLGGYADSGGNSCNGLCSGSQQLSLYIVPSVPLPAPDAASTINGSGSIVSVDQAQLCFANGSTNQSGLITIDNQLTVSLQIKTGETC